MDSAVPSEDSSGQRTRCGDITKTGKAHLRRIVEAAWSYRRPPCIWYGLRRRQESTSEATKEIAWKAQHRLHKRYRKLGAAGKDQRKIATAVARELLGFICRYIDQEDVRRFLAALTQEAEWVDVDVQVTACRDPKLTARLG